MLKKDILISETESVKDALKKLCISSEKVLLVIDKEKKLLGTITDGDIRRYILRGKSLENDIREVYNKEPIYFKKSDFSIELAKKALLDNRIELIPVLDEEHKVMDLVIWDQAFSKDKIETLQAGKLDIPVVIMAGGKGFRLDPFTRILPKPLIPIGDKPIVEIIIEGFRKWGISEYYLTLNHKGGMIKAYFENVKRDYKIKYITEDSFLGTAGSLKLVENEINDTFIISNCDVIVKANFEEVVNFHKEQNASLTILSAIQHYKIPYGVINFKEGGGVTNIQEKPEYTFPINAGVYVVSKDSLRFMPEELPFDMTDLIRNLIRNNEKVAMYPVNESDYIDIGQWEEYKKTIEKLQLFKSDQIPSAAPDEVVAVQL